MARLERLLKLNIESSKKGVILESNSNVSPTAVGVKDLNTKYEILVWYFKIKPTDN